MIMYHKLKMRNIFAGALSAVMVLTSCPSTVLATDDVFLDEAVLSELPEPAEIGAVDDVVSNLNAANDEVFDADSYYEFLSEETESEEASENGSGLIIDADGSSDGTLEDGIEADSVAEMDEEVAIEEDVVSEEATTEETVVEEEVDLVAASEDDSIVEETGLTIAAAAEEEVEVSGKRSFFYTNFTATLTDTIIKVAASNLFVGRGATMKARFVSAEDYLNKIEDQYYGKVLTGIKVIELTFLDASGKEFTPIGLSISIEANEMDAESYVLYRANEYSVHKVGSSIKPAFDFYTSFAETYVFAGLKNDDTPRVEGKRVNGKTVFSLDTIDTKINATAPNGAFYGRISMEAQMASEELVREALENLPGESTDATEIIAYDISFHAGSKEDVEPNKEVAVSINFPVDANNEYKLVHIGDDGIANIVDNADFSEDGVSFTSKDFSIYAIIGTAIIQDEEGTFTFETDEYLINVSYTSEAKIPIGTELVVSQIEQGSDEYWNLWKQSLDKINEDATWGGETDPDTRRGIAAAAFFDISLIYNEEEFEPEVPLQVEITLKKAGLPLFNGQDTEIVHFGKEKMSGNGGTELIDNVQVGTAGVLGNGMPSGVEANTFTFEQTGFSPTGIITTDDYIDFESAVYAGSYVSESTLASRMMRAAVKAAGDPTINAIKTVTDNDSDGIYELALSVNATSQQSPTTKVTKSNVVMVIDVSGSMDEYIYYDTYTYDANTYNDFHYYSSNSGNGTRLYYGDYFYWGRRTGWYSNTGLMGASEPYNGTVYAYETRLHATQRAACAVVDALLEKNETEGISDLYEITVIKFASLEESSGYYYGTYYYFNGTETIIRDSTNGTAIKNSINSLTYGGGTNWEAALNLAKNEADYFRNTDPSRSTDPEEKTSVIFLTDGFPTLYVNNNGSEGGNGQEEDGTVSTSYTEARPSARNIFSSGYDLYNIFAFGSDTVRKNNHTGFEYLRALTNYAYGTGNNDNYNQTDITRQHAFNAKSTSDLVEAFETIVSHITNNVGYAGVNLSDGVSLGATSTSVAVNGTAKVESMRYTVKDASGKLAYSVKISSNGAATFTIYNQDGTQTVLVDNNAETVTTDINGTQIQSSIYLVTTGSGENEKKYKMAPATIDADTGMVRWNLAGLGILESGYTYTVAFDVWPNQLGYDIAADLNNGIYDDIDKALAAYDVTDDTEKQHIKEAIVHNEDGSYSLYTNYSQDVEYYPAVSHTDEEGNETWEYGEKLSQSLPHPDPIPLQGSLLKFRKAWKSELSQKELNELLWKDGVIGGISNEYQITLYMWKADTRDELDSLIREGDPRKAYITEVLGWDDVENKYTFEKEAGVAPGTMVNLAEARELGFDTTDTTKIKTYTNDAGDQFQYYVIENGHYYYVTESGSDLHFELESVLYHPMVVDGDLYNVYFDDNNGTVILMDPMAEVVATNTLKGGLNIHKVVSTTQITVEDSTIVNVNEPVDGGIKTSTDEFTYEIKLWKEDDEGNPSPVYTYENQIDTGGVISGSIGYRILSKPKKGTDGSIVYDDEKRGAILSENDQNANLANGIFATISATETTLLLTMPANGEIRLVNLPSGTKYTVREIVDENGPYHYAATKSQINSGNVLSDGIVTTDNTVSGSISANKASVETYYNWASCFYVYHSSDCTIEKISFADTRVQGTYDKENSQYVYIFNIVNETKSLDDAKFLYGGYYKAYSGAVNSDDEIKNLEYTRDTEGVETSYDDTDTHTGGLWASDEKENTSGEIENAKPYTYANIQNIEDPTSKDKVSWDWDNAYTTDPGTAMHPQADTVYYLKEVPEWYLTNYVYAIFDLKSTVVETLYNMTAMDDNNYNGVKLDSEYAPPSIIYDGSEFTSDKEKFCSGVKFSAFKHSDDTVYAELKTASDTVLGNNLDTESLKGENIFKRDGISEGYICYWRWRIGNHYYPLYLCPVWNTPDGVYVHGFYTGKLDVGNAQLDASISLSIIS